VDGNYDGCILVNFDYEAGFEAIARHVIEEHHVKHPLMMAGIKDNEFSDRRIAIFKKILGRSCQGHSPVGAEPASDHHHPHR
jgi:hypothetical protein